MQRRIAQLETAIIKTGRIRVAKLTAGPWERAQQLPRTFLPGLRAHAFHQLEDYPGLTV